MKLYLYLSFLFFAQISFSQLFMPKQLIDSDVEGAHIKPADFDNDNDQDLLMAGSQLVTWRENLDGLGTFATPITIDAGRGQTFNQAVADIDGDNNIDVLISYFDQDMVVWYRNLGGGNFGPIQVIASNLQRASGISPADLDGDGDLDLVLGVSNGSGLYWVENLDGLGTFGPLITIDAGISVARNQAVGDIDGDNDLDILTNSQGGALLSWYENIDGQGNFSNQNVIDSGGFYENFINLADIDGDGDLDNVSLKTNECLWRENIDGLGDFGANQTIFSYSSASSDLGSVHAIDLDNDNDLDVVYNSAFDFGMVWHFNQDGNGDFGSMNNIPTDTFVSTGGVQPVDLDNDGDTDLVYVSLFFSENRTDLFWLENRTILGVNDELFSKITLSPNPVNDTLYIETQLLISKVKVYSLLGEMLFEHEEETQEINVSRLSNGLFFLTIETEEGRLTKKFVKK